MTNTPSIPQFNHVEVYIQGSPPLPVGTVQRTAIIRFSALAQHQLAVQPVLVLSPICSILATRTILSWIEQASCDPTAPFYVTGNFGWDLQLYTAVLHLQIAHQKPAGVLIFSLRNELQKRELTAYELYDIEAAGSQAYVLPEHYKREWGHYINLVANTCAHRLLTGSVACPDRFVEFLDQHCPSLYISVKNAYAEQQKAMTVQRQANGIREMPGDMNLEGVSLASLRHSVTTSSEQPEAKTILQWETLTDEEIGTMGLPSALAGAVHLLRRDLEAKKALWRQQDEQHLRKREHDGRAT